MESMINGTFFFESLLCATSEQSFRDSTRREALFYLRGLFTVRNPFSVPAGRPGGIHFPASFAINYGLWVSSGQWDLSGHD